jgi:D-amino-acid dehydrogenase
MSFEVVVVGGGVVGSFIVNRLASAGYKLSWVLGPDPRDSAAWGSAGYVAVGSGTPILTYQGILKLAKWVISPDSPVKLRTGFLISNAGWLRSYITRGRKLPLEALQLIRGLALQTLDEIQRLVDAGEINVELSRKGTLLVFSSERYLEDHLLQTHGLRRLGVKYTALGASECREIEPNLSNTVVGGVLYHEDAWVNPARLLLEMRRRAGRLGVMSMEGWAREVVFREGLVEGVKVGSDIVRGDTVVLAMGARTASFLQGIGCRLPLAAAWGYTVTLARASWKLSRPVMLGETRLAISQTEEGCPRLSGFFELAPVNHSPPPERYTWLRAKAAALMPSLTGLPIIDRWAGMRPCTPDGLPVIGRLKKHPQLLIATGHCREGLTLAGGTARLIEDVLRSHKAAQPLLSPLRFGL